MKNILFDIPMWGGGENPTIQHKKGGSVIY